MTSNIYVVSLTGEFLIGKSYLNKITFFDTNDNFIEFLKSRTGKKNLEILTFNYYDVIFWKILKQLLLLNFFDEDIQKESNSKIKEVFRNELKLPPEFIRDFVFNHKSNFTFYQINKEKFFAEYPQEDVLSFLLETIQKDYPVFRNDEDFKKVESEVLTEIKRLDRDLEIYSILKFLNGSIALRDNKVLPIEGIKDLIKVSQKLTILFMEVFRTLDFDFVRERIILNFFRKLKEVSSTDSKDFLILFYNYSPVELEILSVSKEIKSNPHVFLKTTSNFPKVFLSDAFKKLSPGEKQKKYRFNPVVQKYKTIFKRQKFEKKNKEFESKANLKIINNLSFSERLKFPYKNLILDLLS